MPPTGVCASAPDWGCLPGDVLEQVFAHLLRPRHPAAGLPLRALLHQLLTLAGTCRHWAAVAAAAPLQVELYAAPAACLAWLAGRHVRLLRVASSPAAAAAAAVERQLLEAPLDPGESASAQQRRLAAAARAVERLSRPPAQPLAAWRAERAVGWDPEAGDLFPWVAAAAGHISYDAMLAGLAGVRSYSIHATRPPRAAPDWGLAAWRQLQARARALPRGASAAEAPDVLQAGHAVASTASTSRRFSQHPTFATLPTGAGAGRPGGLAWRSLRARHGGARGPAAAARPAPALLLLVRPQVR